VRTYTHIHSVRHASTTFGEEQRYAGTIDVPLSARGVREAKAAAAGLRGTKFDVVITSMKTRAIDTARLLVGDSVPMVRCSFCNERNYGAMEGHTILDVKRFKPSIMFVKVGNDTHSVDPPGGEPFEDVRERAKKFRRFILKHHRGARILVVSHGVFLQQFHGLVRGKSCIESLADWVSNLEMTAFTLSGSRLVEERSVKLIGKKRVDF
jgi:2,3-bisphosphoglycerate-dependent phosphoglycerate mutase